VRSATRCAPSGGPTPSPHGSDHPVVLRGLGSAWSGVVGYGYVAKDLARIRGGDPAAWSRAYRGGGSPVACREQLASSLSAAVDRVLAEQGVDSLSELAYDKHLDDIRATTAGVVGVRPIDWQNRPTFQQVVAFTGGR
jgi:hypothetical protein